MCSHKGAVAIRQPYIRVVGIEDANDANTRGSAAFTQEEVIIKFIQRFFSGKNNFSILRMYVYYEVPVAKYFCVTKLLLNVSVLEKKIPSSPLIFSIL